MIILHIAVALSTKCITLLNLNLSQDMKNTPATYVGLMAHISVVTWAN